MSSERAVLQRLRITYLLALCFIGTLSGLMHWMLSEVIDRQSDSAAVINIAGRQRMLSQRIVYLARDALIDPANSEDLRSAIDLMERSNNALMKGDPEMGIAANVVERQEIKSYAPTGTRLTADVAAFLQYAKIVADLAAPLDERQAAFTRVHNAARAPLLRDLDVATKEIEQRSSARISSLRRAQEISLIVLLSTLVLEALLIFRPLLNRIRSYLERLYIQATTDGLTGLANRRHFLEMAEAAVRAHTKDDRPAAVLMADIDKFKLINDRYGHAVGDQALIWFAGLLRRTLGDTHIIGRLGGEEFAILLPGADLEQASQEAERLRLAVENGEPPGDVPKFTVSIGAAPVLRNEATLEAAIKIADDALYAAKVDGRNRVVKMDRLLEATA